MSACFVAGVEASACSRWDKLKLELQRAVVCLALLAGLAAVPAQAAEEAKETEAKKEAPKEAVKTEEAPQEEARAEETPKEAAKAEEKKETEKSVLTPEQFFEGGTKTCNNWVEVGVG